MTHVAPLSPTQQLLFCFEHTTPGTASYCVEQVVGLAGPVDVPRLEQALVQVVQRHDSLRAYFSSDVGPDSGVPAFLGFVQRFADRVQVQITVTEGGVSCAPWLERVLRRPIPLDRAPLMHANLLRVSDHECVFAVVVHHLVWDGWSAGIFFSELHQAYGALLADRPWVPAAAAPSYGQYALAKQAAITPAWLAEELAWWKARFAGAAHSIALPHDRAYPLCRSFEGGTEWLSVPAAIGHQLRAIGRRYRATPFIVLSAAFAVLLSRYTGPDVVWGAPFANREGEGLEAAIGDFATALPLRLDVADDPAFPTVLARVRTAVLETLDHQAIPFQKLVSALQGRPQLQRHPIFQVLLQFDREGPGHRFPLGDLTAEMRPTDSISCTLDLRVGMWESADGDGFAGRVEYRTDLFDATTVARMVQEFVAVLESITHQPAAVVSKLLAGP